MADTSFATLQKIIGDALELPVEDRRSFVEKSCERNPSLLKQALSLLDAQEGASRNGFLQLPDGEETVEPEMPPFSKHEASLTEGPGSTIGRYKLLERIGEGGFGFVYVAEQTVPMKRRVAIKVIKAGMDTRQVVARFEAERQALAMMDHPNIARVLDGGATESGRPYFVMELVKGVPITRFCDDNKLTPRQRVELIVPVCQAVQHAHQKGIIHRDIKPQNVLVTLHDGKPVPKVIDFGIAKATSQPLTDKTVYTEFRQMIGTPAYMSPEQAEMSGLDIDTRSDIYSLGVLAYELLTGMPPFDTARLVKAGMGEIQRIIREEEPPRPSMKFSTMGETLTTIASKRSTEASRLGKLVAGELDWIVMRAMEKDRTRRYESAADLAMDFERHLNGEPIVAAPPTLAYRLRKYSTRHKAAMISALVFVLLLFLAAIGTSFGLVREHYALQIAENNRMLAQKAGDEAAQQAKLALAAKADADQQARSAQKAALLAQARYSIQQAEIPEAANLLQQVDHYDLKPEEQLAGDALLKAARSQWTLMARIPTGGRVSAGCIAKGVDGNNLLVGAIGSRVFSQPLSPNAPVVTRDLKIYSLRVLKMRDPADYFVVAAGPQLQTYNLHTLDLIKSVKLKSSIRLIDTSKQSVAYVLDDGTIGLVDAVTFENRGEWKWDEVKSASSITYLPRIFAVSPDDRFLIVHAGPWNVPTVSIDRTANKTSSGEIRLGEAAFDSRSPTRLYTWFAPGRSGGLMDEFFSYDLADGIKELTSEGVYNNDTKDTVHLERGLYASGLFGAVGVTRREGYGSNNAVRYLSMWPFQEDAPSYLTCDNGGEMLAVATTREVLVFSSATLNRIDSRIEDWTSTATDSGVFSMEWRDWIHYQPISFTGKSFMVPLVPPKPVEKRVWWPQSMHVSPDESKAAVLFQSTENEQTITDVYHERKLLIYDLLAGSDNPSSWKPIKEVELSMMPNGAFMTNRLVRLSPNGNFAVVGLTDGTVVRVDCNTGEQRGQWQFDSRYEVSADGMYIAGCLTGGHDLKIFRIADGNEQATLKNVTAIAGGCFSDDNTMFLVSRASRKLEAYSVDDGKLLWTKPSRLIPRAWCVAMHRFAGSVVEQYGAGSKLVLANVDTGETLADLCKFADHRNDIAFRNNGKAIYFQRDRWDYEITRFQSAGQFLADMVKPVLPMPDASAQISPPVADRVSVPNDAVDASDLEKLSDLVSKPVVLSGNVAEIHPTFSGGHFNLLLEPAKEGVLLFLRNKNITAFNEAFEGDFNGMIVGRPVIIRGTLNKYGGSTTQYKDRFQIELTDPGQIQIVQ